MNKVRRKEISECGTSLRIIIGKLEMLRDEEQDYFDNMPENLQYSMRADDSQEAIDKLEEIISSLEDMADECEVF